MFVEVRVKKRNEIKVKKQNWTGKKAEKDEDDKKSISELNPP